MALPETSGSPGSPDSKELKKALKAFKKRLKLTRLDEESKLGVGPMSKGGNSGIVAIQLPAEYPKPIWDELVKQGRLRYVGHGLYELVQK